MALRSKNAHYHFKDISPRHWYELAMKHGGLDTWHAMRELAENVESAIKFVERELPQDFPDHTWNSISTGTSIAATRFLSFQMS